MKREEEIEIAEMLEKALEQSEVIDNYYHFKREKRVAVQNYVSKVVISVEMGTVLTKIMYRFGNCV
jgi:hypothetical protein